MALTITRGKIGAPVRGIFYGSPGVGKSTLASLLPDPIFIDIEKSTEDINLVRSTATDWRAIEFAVKDIIKDQQGFKTVVFDTADWAEKALIEHISRLNGGKGIEEWDGGFGKGYTMLSAAFAKFLAECTKLTDAGLHVVFTAHSHVKKVSPPDQVDSFDRYEMKLTKQVCPLLQEWSTLILFYNHRIELMKGRDKRVKGTGAERVIYTTKTAAFDAKNRYGLPAEIEAPTPEEAYAKIAYIFERPTPPCNILGIPSNLLTGKEKEPVTTLTYTKEMQEQAKQVVDKLDAARTPMITADQIHHIQTVSWMESSKTAIDSALQAANAVGLDELTEGQAADLIDTLSHQDAPPVVPNNIMAWLDANAETVEKYLQGVKWLQAGATWRTLTMERLNYIIDNAPKFARAAGLPALP